MSEQDIDIWFYPLRRGDTLSNHDWIPLYINRLLTSDFLAYAVAEDRRADVCTALILWAECFKQDPAGTLPDDDVQLAQIARYGSDVDAWRRARPGALHGWERCEVEGVDERRDRPRLSHPMIASIALDMHKRKCGRDQAREAGRLATLRNRVKKKLAGLGYRKSMAESDKVITAVAGWLDQNSLYCTDENVRMAMETAVGIPRAVDQLDHRRTGV
jgi:hypothetical protein